VPSDLASAMLDPADLAGDADLFVGSEHGGLALTSLVVPPGSAAPPPLRRHPHPMVYVVGAGEATFLVGGEVLVAGPGQLVVAPPHVAHGYANAGPGELRLTAIQSAVE
jgi:mannose-6-phosphate isomerase-like protein (cupin superfamily)